MAIQVSGTTVINDSRQLQNVASVDATTVASMSAGLPAPSPPAALAVGAYILGRPENQTVYAAGDTVSGIYSITESTNAGYAVCFDGAQWSNAGPVAARKYASGTWKAMAPSYTLTTAYNVIGFTTMWVRTA